jgi:putative serine protease PepD
VASDDDDEQPGFGKPLPPDDRLWRHPSEMGGDSDHPQIVLVSRSSTSLWKTLLFALLAGLVGAGMTLAIVVGTDAFVRERPGDVSREVHDVTPPRAPGETELAIADKVLPAVARIEVFGSHGPVSATAVVFRSDGQLITTADAIDGEQTITVFLNDGTKVSTPDVTIVGKSIDADIAVLKIPRTDLPVATGTPGGKVGFGDQVVMVDASPVTRGPEITIGYVNKEVASVSREDKPAVYGLIETTSRGSVTPRSAGTVFVDAAGTVIGIVSSRAESPDGSPGDSQTTPGTAPGSSDADEGNTLHFAIPANLAWNVAAQLADTGRYIKPWVGVSGQDISSDEAARLNLVGGMRITSVESNSPAEAAHLRVDDVIDAVEDDNVTGYNDWVAALRRHKPGEQVSVTFIRNGESQPALLTIGAQPGS